MLRHNAVFCEPVRFLRVFRELDLLKAGFIERARLEMYTAF